MPTVIDLKDRVFGDLTVLEKTTNKNKRTRWICLCKCGEKAVVYTTNLTRNHTRSCGCLQVKRAQDRTEDLTNHVFGRLTAMEIVRDVSKTLWLCKCICNNEITVSADRLKSGMTKSCGCFRREFKRKPSEEVGFLLLLKSYKCGAKNRDLIWELTDDKVREITKLNCYYCDSIPSNIKKSKRVDQIGNTGYLYNGIDRIDSNLGYTTENCVPCCTLCNYMKFKLSEIVFESQIEKIYNFKIKTKLINKNK